MEIIFPIIAYIFGSINGAVILTRFFYKKDIRKIGSHNPGTVNILRNFGIFPALLVFIFDFGKSFVLLNYLMSCSSDRYLFTLCALLSVLGHCYPITHGFNGGKGIATTFGVLVAFSPSISVLLLAICAILALSLRNLTIPPLVSMMLFIPASVIISSLEDSSILPSIILSLGIFSTLLSRHFKLLQNIICE